MQNQFFPLKFTDSLVDQLIKRYKNGILKVKSRIDLGIEALKILSNNFNGTKTTFHNIYLFNFILLC